MMTAEQRDAQEVEDFHVGQNVTIVDYGWTPDVPGVVVALEPHVGHVVVHVDQSETVCGFTPDELEPA
jgi:hypothetical protein